MSCLLSSQSKYIFSYRFICIRQDKVSLQKKQFSKLIAANHLSIWNTVCSLRGCSIKQIHSGPVKSLSVKANVAEIYIIYTARGGMRCLMETLSERWLHDTWISSVKRKAVDMRGHVVLNASLVYCPLLANGQHFTCTVTLCHFHWLFGIKPSGRIM